MTTSIEPSETYLVIATARINNTRHIGAAIGHTASITPDVHAIPFPPLKLRKNGKLCPSTAPKPAYSSMHLTASGYVFLYMK